MDAKPLAESDFVDLFALINEERTKKKLDIYPREGIEFYRFCADIPAAISEYRFQTLDAKVVRKRLELALKLSGKLSDALELVQRAAISGGVEFDLYKESQPVLSALHPLHPYEKRLKAALDSLNRRMAEERSTRGDTKKRRSSNSAENFEVFVGLLATLWTKYTGSAAGVSKSSNLLDRRKRGGPFVRFVSEILSRIDPHHGRLDIGASIEKLLHRHTRKEGLKTTQ